MKHKNILVKPCNIDWKVMEPQTDGNRFCHLCQKVVYDMSEMSSEEADSFLQDNPGSCGNFLASQIDAAPEEARSRPSAFAKGGTWKKAAAAAAAITLLHGSMPADLLHTDLSEAGVEQLQSNSPKISPERTGPSTNTLLTGVVLSNEGYEIHDPISMTLSCGEKLTDIPVSVKNGLFIVDLKDKASPSDTIEIYIPEQSIKYTRYSETRFKTTLGEGQNLSIPVVVHYARRTGGVMIRKE